MELLHERCAALDIGKKDLKACVRTPSPKGKRSRRQEIRTFATTTNRCWSCGTGCSPSRSAWWCWRRLAITGGARSICWRTT